MRFLVFSDPQLDNYKQGSRSISGVNSRLLHGLFVLQQIAEYAKKNDIHTIVCVGDVLERRHFVEVSVLDLASTNIYSEFDGINLIFVAGNHDFEDDRCQTNILKPLFAQKFVVASEYRQSSFDPGIVFHYYPFTKKVKILEPTDTSKTNIAFMHYPIDSAFLTAKYQVQSPITKGMFKGYDAAFFGDIHRHQVVQDKPPMVVVGSPMQLNWGDMDQKRGFLDVDVSGKDITWKLVETKHPKFVKSVLKDWTKEAERLKGNFVSIKSNEPIPELETIAEFVFYEPEYAERKTEQRLDIDHTTSYIDILSQYIDYKKPSLDKERLVEMVKEILNDAYLF